MQFTRQIGRPCGSFRKIRRSQWPLMLAVLLNCAAASFAQEYLTLPIDDKTAKTYRVTAQQCLRDPAAFAANKEKFDQFFSDYYFPQMTIADPERLGDIGKLRADFFKNYLYKANSAEVQAELTKLAYASMGKIVGAQNPPCHPAARYNAILIIGLLDEQYSPDGKQAPKPYGQATKALTAVVDSATTSTRFSPPVVLGAIIGLERHAQLRAALPPEAVTAMQAALVKLVTHEQPIQDMDRDAYSWLRLRAASVLARLGTVGEKNANHDAIVKLAASAKSIDDRCSAIALLQKINYKDVKLNEANNAEPIFVLARDVAAAEDKRAKDFQEKGLTGGFTQYQPVPMIGPEYGGAGAPTYDPNAFQRRITLARLTDLKSGLAAVKPGLPAETQQKVDELLAAINPVISSASGKDSTDLNLAAAIRTMAQAINKSIPAKSNPQDEKAKEDAAFST